MTFSILVRDPDTGALGGAAATGNLCVGAWVLRGEVRAGLTASQGLYPNPSWSGQVLDLMAAGRDPAEAVARVVGADRGAGVRQLSALDGNGASAVHTGADNLDWSGHLAATDLMATGNMLASLAVLQAAVAAFAAATGALAARLIAALAAGAAAGGDIRGLLSAAVLVVSHDEPPLDLRIDHAADPIGALDALYHRTLDPAYQAWLAGIPTLNDPERRP
jgi:uncharacterized Ntn-hydrolase superfamily protein